ncbi:MAG: hypothetical protein ACRC2T_14905 [Thermoguttaceae bacterium]
MKNHESRIVRKYNQCFEEILDSDLILFRGIGVIPVFGRGSYTHCGKASWWNGDLFCLEVREFIGGRAVRLESLVKKYPGRIDVFRTNPENRWASYRRDQAVEIMKRFAGCDYGYLNVFMAAITHLPIIRFFVNPSIKNTCHERNEILAPFCSQACAHSDRVGGGVDPVPHLADRFTEPCDLARSVFYQYMFTIE